LTKEAEFKEGERAKIIAFQHRLVGAKDSRSHWQNEIEKAEKSKAQESAPGKP
jgi:hypothetical protein